MSNIPPKPKREDYSHDLMGDMQFFSACRNYERARAERAIEALKAIASDGYYKENRIAEKALAELTTKQE